MKKFLMVLLVVLCFIPSVFAYDFGDYRSVTLATKAWDALGKNDIEGVLAYTNKCIELYAAQAKKMQGNLTDFAKGSEKEIFSYWALNDVATCLFIQGEAYRNAKMGDEAKEVYAKLIKEYTYGQCWDPNGKFFWKPSEAAQEKLNFMEKGGTDFGDNTSQTLTTKAWAALNSGDLDAVLAYTDKCLSLYSAKAQEMQKSLTEYPYESNEKIFSYWALNDVGTCLFIKGEAYKKAGQYNEAKKAFQELLQNYSFAQAWDPNGWFWKPSEAAQQKLDELNEI